MHSHRLTATKDLAAKRRSSPVLRMIRIACAVLVAVSTTACLPANPTVDGAIPDATLNSAYTALAWNDLGMHCLNPTYDKAVILPPYNTVWVQVVKRGAPPEIVTSGLTVEYSLVGNTSSHDKRNYGQFWTNANALFGAVGLADDKGLNLEDPDVHNGLSGLMLVKGNHFQANGIPVVPVGDDLVWNPFQQIAITVKNAQGAVVATTKAMVPTSDEINCAKCHGTGTVASAFDDILAVHDTKNQTNLAGAKPVLCASCHGSPALGTAGAGTAGLYLSEAIHGFHATKAGVTCYDCHPGAATKCSRSVAHSAADGNCASCHGNMANVASTIADNGRVPWANEPTCGSCHAASGTPTRTAVNPGAVSAIAQVDTGSALYRNASGHGGVACAACHSSPHAMVPSREAKDNYQALQYQGKAVTIGSCSVCHDDSHGGGFDGFFEEHGGGEQDSACKVCHTGFASAAIAQAPHQFQWRAR
jgi:hypothetical protein